MHHHKATKPVMEPKQPICTGDPTELRISSVVTAGISVTEAPINSTVLFECLNKSVGGPALYTVTFP